MINFRLKRLEYYDSMAHEFGNDGFEVRIPCEKITCKLPSPRGGGGRAGGLWERGGGLLQRTSVVLEFASLENFLDLLYVLHILMLGQYFCMTDSESITEPPPPFSENSTWSDSWTTSPRASGVGRGWTSLIGRGSTTPTCPGSATGSIAVRTRKEDNRQPQQ